MTEIVRTLMQAGVLRVVLFGTGVLAGFWIPVRMVFFGRLAIADTLCELFFIGAVALAWRAQPRAGMRVLAAITGAPLVTLAALLWSGDPSFLFAFKLLAVRHLLEVRGILDQRGTMQPIAYRLLPLAAVVPAVMHLVACGWVVLGSGTAGPSDDKWFEYGRALYWAITTLATVGYGDISAKTLPQMAYASVTMVVGVGFFGFVLSNVASLLSRMDAAREHHLSMLDRVEGFMGSNRLPEGLKRNVRSYFQYLWENHRGFNDDSITHMLPRKLQIEIALHLNADVFQKVPLFKGADAALLQDIALQLKHTVVVPSEAIFRAGDPGEAMYFIHRGSVEIVSTDGTVLATLHPGSFFGEGALLTPNPRSATARATDYCDLFVLKRSVFEAVLSRYPAFAKHLHALAQQRGGSTNSPAKKAA